MAVDVVVLQGEREMASDNRQLARFRLEGIRPAPRGQPQIEVTFDMDANGILNVSARDQGTEAEQKVTIAESANLDSGEIERMVRDDEEVIDAEFPRDWRAPAVACTHDGRGARPGGRRAGGAGRAAGARGGSLPACARRSRQPAQAHCTRGRAPYRGEQGVAAARVARGSRQRRASAEPDAPRSRA